MSFSSRSLLPVFLRLLQTSVLDLKEKASSLASSSVKKDNRLKCLEIGLEQKREECVQLENQLKKVTVMPQVHICFGLRWCEISPV